MEDLLRGKKEKKKGKKIEFKALVSANEVVQDVGYEPNEFDNIVLISKGYSNGLDLILAWNDEDDSSARCAFLGYWNDGLK